jgi:hypothetical protein
MYRLSLDDVRYHLTTVGIDPRYIIWTWHGEVDPNEISLCDSTDGHNYEDYDMDTLNDVADTIEMFEAVKENDVVGDEEKFQELLKDAKKPLYNGCKKYTKLSAIVKLYSIKAKSGWSDKSFSDVLTLFADMLPIENELPLTTREARCSMSVFGMEYKKIHACPNDCILYRLEHENATSCPECGTSRYKVNKNVTEQSQEGQNKGVPVKVLWYFPPIPRFKRWFQSRQTAKDLTWHADRREVDGQLRHPADSPTWKTIDEKWPEFAAETRNLRLSLSADGINPFSSLSSRYSCWPVMLNTYNLPPWLCMKRKFTMLTLLISGPRQPGNDIDVYLAPLIEDLQLLWEDGVEAYDAHRRESFTLRSVLLWTVNDFPAYGNLSGCCVKGYFACPICNENTYSDRLRNCNKNIYTGHRRYLPHDHSFRSQRKAFNGEKEFGSHPKPLSGEQILMKVGGIKVSWGKKKVKLHKSTSKKRKKGQANEDSITSCWKKKSIFFELQYWKYLPIRHNLDLMHIEKNVCDNIIGTLLNIPGKSKDGLNCRKDLEEMGLRKELAPRTNKRGTYLPAACYTLSRAEKRMVCETLYELKVPDGYSSNFRSHVSMEDLKLYGLKSHDCHVLMQQSI